MEKIEQRPEDRHDTLYHYCDAKALQGIITDKSIRLTSIFHLEDQQEYRLFRDVIARRLKERGADGNNDTYDNLIKYLNSDDYAPLYCACFSQHDDMLTQWKMYGDNGNGYSIGFNRNHFTNIIVDKQRTQGVRLTWQEVEYSNAWHVSKADDIIDMAMKTDYKDFHRFAVETSIWFWAAMCKNSAFEPEKEVRLIQRDQGNEQFKVRANRIVPFVNVEFDPSREDEPPITSIRFGPKFPKSERRMIQSNVNSIWLMMDRCGYACRPTFSMSNLQLL